MGFARKIASAINEGKSAAAIKTMIEQTGVHFMSPFFMLWSGFNLEQIRLDLAHIIQVLMKRLVKAVGGKRDPKESKGAKSKAAKNASKGGGREGAEADEKGNEENEEREEREEKEEKEEGPVAPGQRSAKRKAPRVTVAAGPRARAPEQERNLRPQRSQRQKTNTGFVDLDDFDWSDQEQEGAREVVVDDLDVVALEVDVEPEGDVDVPGGHVDYEVETILNERGSEASGDREFLVLWKRWPKPTWQPLDLSHEIARWEGVRESKGWPNIDEKAQRAELAKKERAEANRRLSRMRVADSVANAADKFIAQKLITPSGFSPRPSQFPCQRISSLNIWDWMRFVEVWGGVYIYHLGLKPDVSQAILTYLDALRLLLKRSLGQKDRDTMHLQMMEALVGMSRSVWPDTEQGCFLHLCTEIARDAKRWLPRKPNMLSKERCVLATFASFM
jgi:hypothetical protein